MDRNTVTGFVLIAAILIVWSVLSKPSEEELAEQKRKMDSIALVREAENDARQAKQFKELEIQKKEITEIDDNANIEELKAQYGSFASAAAGAEKFCVVENELLKIKFTNKGAKPYSVELKNYKTHDQKPLMLFDGDSTIFGTVFFSAQNRAIQTNEMFFSSLNTDSFVIVTENAYQVKYQLASSEDSYIEYVYTIEPNSYMLNFNMNFVGMSQAISPNSNTLDLNWETYIPQSEKGFSNENQYSTVAYKHYLDEVDELQARGKKQLNSEDIPTQLKWVAFKDQFFSSVLISKESFTNGQVEYEVMPEGSNYIKKVSAELGVEYNHLPSESKQFQFYFGPNKYKLLKTFDGYQLEELVPLGSSIIRWINQYVIIKLFDFLNSYFTNFGIIILIMTFIIKMALFPLTFKSFKSQARMRVLKPQIDEINKKIPADKAMERQQATMELYRKVGINPMGGCLPMLLQMPILFAMFRFFPSSIELRQQSFLWATDLSTYDAIVEWDAVIPLISNTFGNHISLFTILMTVTTMISMKTSGQTQSSAQMPGMKGMMYIMPVMFMFVLNKFSAGLTYYYFLANMITLGQNFIFKQMIDEDEILKKLEARKAKPKKKSGFQKRLEEAAKQRGVQPPKRK